MKTLSYTLKAMGLGLAVAALSPLAHAQDPIINGKPGIRSITVPYGDLDLSRPAGIEVMYTRLRSAAERVCAPHKNLRNLTMRRHWRQCFDNALDEPVAILDNPRLSGAHAARTGRDVGSDRHTANAN